jgi:hypothetical protein
VRDTTSESVALANAGLALIHLGRHRQGMALVRESLVLEERNGGLPEMADMHQELGHTLEQTGHLPEAWAAFSEHRRLSTKFRSGAACCAELRKALRPSSDSVKWRCARPQQVRKRSQGHCRSKACGRWA